MACAWHVCDVRTVQRGLSSTAPSAGAPGAGGWWGPRVHVRVPPMPDPPPRSRGSTTATSTTGAGARGRRTRGSGWRSMPWGSPTSPASSPRGSTPSGRKVPGGGVGWGRSWHPPDPPAPRRYDWVTSYKVQVSNDTHTWQPCRNGTREAVSARREHPGGGDGSGDPPRPARLHEQSGINPPEGLTDSRLTVPGGVNHARVVNCTQGLTVCQGTLCRGGLTVPGG